MQRLQILFPFRRQQYIGKSVYSHLDIISPVKKVIVATNQNVVAALSLKSGDILWRQILEQGKEGTIQLLYVDNEIVTVSGTRSPVVRGWDLENGHALFEWPMGPVSVQTFPRWAVIEDMLVLLQFPHGEAVAQWFNLRTGAAVANKRLPLDVLDPSQCVTQAVQVVCLEPDGLLTVVTPGNAGDLNVRSKSITDQVGDVKTSKLEAIEGKLPLVSVESADRKWIVEIEPEIKVAALNVGLKALLSSAPTDEQDLIVSTEVINSVSCLDSCQVVANLIYLFLIAITALEEPYPVTSLLRLFITIDNIKSVEQVSPHIHFLQFCSILAAVWI